MILLPTCIPEYRDFLYRRIRSAASCLLLVCLVVLLSGCAAWWAPSPGIQYDSEATRQLMDRLVKANTGLDAFRGKGRVLVNSQGTRRTYNRTAWVGAEPGRLRFAFQSMPGGPPVFSMSCDEMWLTALNHTDGKYYSRRVGDNSLSSFLPVQIKCADLYRLLVGRPPQVEYDSVRLDPQIQNGADPIVILLQRRFRGTVGRISVNRATGELSAAELLDVHGNRLYAARVDAMQTIDGYRLPANVKLTGPDGNLELDVQHTWPGASITKDLFRIAPPQSD
jgi:hypothetical protein